MKMVSSKVMVRAALIGVALGLIQGCAGQPKEKSLTESVVQSMYTKRMYITGSRLPKQVDTRKALDSQSAQPLKVVRKR
jgi:hypothetical protein